MLLKGTLFFILLLLFSPEILSAQDPTFSQFYSNRLYLNPALAGIEDGRRLYFNYRNQFPTLDNSYLTYSVSYDQNIESIHGGFGFSVMNDVQGSGSLTQLGFSAIYSYHIQISRDLSVNGGLQSTFFQRKLNASEFIFGDNIDPGTGNIIPGSEVYSDFKKDFLDFSTGTAAFYKNLYGGISVFHLLKPVQSLSSNPDARLPRKFILYMGGYFPVYEKRFKKEIFQLNPNLIYIQQKNLTQLSYGLEILLQNRFAAGFMLRQNLGINFSALIFSGGIAFDKIRFRYSYDAQLSLPTVNFTSQGAHEITLIITTDGEKKINHKAIKCPKF
jgi:type IX secretion system PorP/SprF family membrane protein